MIRSIHALKFIIIISIGSEFCFSMNEWKTSDPGFAWALQESMNVEPDLTKDSQEVLRKVMQLAENDNNYDNAYDDFLNLISLAHKQKLFSDGYEWSDTKIRDQFYNVWINTFSQHIIPIKKSRAGFESWFLFYQKVHSPNIPSYLVVKKYPVFSEKRDRDLLVLADHLYQKYINFESTPDIIQLPCLIQNYPWIYYDNNGKRYYDGNLCGWYSVFFVREMLDSDLDINNVEAVKSKVNTREKFDTFLLHEKHGGVPHEGDLTELNINKLLLFHLPDKKESAVVLSQSIYCGDMTEESSIYLFYFSDDKETAKSYITDKGQLMPFFENFLKKGRVGMVFWCPIDPKTTPQEGSIQHWIGSVLYLTEAHDIKMVVVDSLGVQRVGTDDYTTKAYQWFKDTWLEWLQLNNIKLPEKKIKKRHPSLIPEFPQLLKKKHEDQNALVILQKLLQSLKIKLVNLIKQVQSLSMS